MSFNHTAVPNEYTFFKTVKFNFLTPMILEIVGETWGQETLPYFIFFMSFSRASVRIKEQERATSGSLAALISLGALLWEWAPHSNHSTNETGLNMRWTADLLAILYAKPQQIDLSEPAQLFIKKNIKQLVFNVLISSPELPWLVWTWYVHHRETVRIWQIVASGTDMWSSQSCSWYQFHGYGLSWPHDEC